MEASGSCIPRPERGHSQGAPAGGIRYFPVEGYSVTREGKPRAGGESEVMEASGSCIPFASCLPTASGESCHLASPAIHRGTTQPPGGPESQAPPGSVPPAIPSPPLSKCLRGKGWRSRSSVVSSVLSMGVELSLPMCRREREGNTRGREGCRQCLQGRVLSGFQGLRSVENCLEI